MPNLTPTQRIVALESEVTTIAAEFDKGLALNKARLEDLSSSIKKLEATIEKLQEKQSEATAKLAAFDERLKALDKISDRHWQIWLAIGGAALALLVALLKK